MCVCVYVCVHVCMCVYVCLCVCVCVCMCMFVCVYDNCLCMAVCFVTHVCGICQNLRPWFYYSVDCFPPRENWVTLYSLVSLRQNNNQNMNTIPQYYCSSLSGFYNRLNSCTYHGMWTFLEYSPFGFIYLCVSVCCLLGFISLI